MKKYFLDLFEYNNWANDKILLKLQNITFQFNGINPFSLLSHIVAVQDEWLERVKGTKSHNIYIWEEYSIQEIEILSLNSHKNWIRFISNFKEDDFKALCKYKDSKQKKKSKAYQDIFQHVINHSTYHRGQINQILRMNGIEPVVIDFIYYC